MGEDNMENGFRTALGRLGHALPEPAAAKGRYAGYVRAGNLFVSVQGPLVGEAPRWTGRIGRDLDMTAAAECARLTMLNVLAQLAIACDGDPARVRRCIRLGGYLNTPDGYADHTLVMNHASEIVLGLFGERGQHARFVVGCNSLPFDLAMEIEAMFEID